MERLKQIKEQLKTAPKTGVYKLKETKKEMLNFYGSKLKDLEKVSEETFKKHCFVSELIKRCEQKERRSYIPKLKKIIKGLERHVYAPELNELQTIKGNVYKTPQKTEIDNAIEFIVFNNSISKIRSIILKG